MTETRILPIDVRLRLKTGDGENLKRMEENNKEITLDGK